MAASPTKGTYLSSQYHRLAPRRGKRRARKAVGHSILVALWHILDVEGMTYEDLGADWFDRRNDPARRARRKLAELRNLGCDLTANPDGTFTLAVPAA
jgi:transposase